MMWRITLCISACLWTSIAGSAETPTAPSPSASAPNSGPEELFASPQATSAALAADGKHLAVIKEGRVFVTSTADRQVVGTVGGELIRSGRYLYRAWPKRVLWVTNTLFAVDMGIAASVHDLSGDKQAEVGSGLYGKAEPNRVDSPWLLIFTNPERTAMARVNVLTHEWQRIRLPGVGRPLHWAFDEVGLLRAVTMSSAPFWQTDARLVHWYLPAGTSHWEKLAEATVDEETWQPVRAVQDRDELVVYSRQGRDTYALFSYDPLKRRFGEMLAGHPTEDILGFEAGEAGDFERVHTAGMKPVQHWFEPDWVRVQKAVDAALPRRVNRLSGDPKGKVLVFSFADVDPGRWYLLDAPSMTMTLVAQAMPGLDPAAMRPMEIIRYAARDGLGIPAYLTRPVGSATGPLPMVVLVHGGPTARDHWRWDPDVQLLAAQGYVVFQPQFRGSSGFGKAFEQAGYGQWGRAMQDDITAGVQHLVREGVADPDRICIYGASYGGYAALWGLAKTPSLYRCGISLNGVTDIQAMLTDRSDTNDSRHARDLLRFRVGDRQQDRAHFDEVSPLKNAHRIQVPVLLVHGEEDERVPISHGRTMLEALQKHGKVVEWLPVPREGHSFYFLKSVLDVNRKLLAFLEQHIGPTRTQQATLKPSR